jgi:DNA-binding response OmpR family regulator
VFDEENHAVNGHRVAPKVWGILTALRRRPGHIVTKRAMEEALYDHAADYPNSRTVDVYICKARKALASTPHRIVNVWSVGWRLDQVA